MCARLPWRHARCTAALLRKGACARRVARSCFLGAAGALNRGRGRSSGAQVAGVAALLLRGLRATPLGLGGSLRLPSLTEPRLRPRALRPAPLGLLASSSSPPHADSVLRDGAPLVVYEDEDFLVVDKVKCLVKSPHPTGGVCNSKD